MIILANWSVVIFIAPAADSIWILLPVLNANNTDSLFIRASAKPAISLSNANCLSFAKETCWFVNRLNSNSFCILVWKSKNPPAAPCISSIERPNLAAAAAALVILSKLFPKAEATVKLVFAICLKTPLADIKDLFCLLNWFTILTWDSNILSPSLPCKRVKYDNCSDSSTDIPNLSFKVVIVSKKSSPKLAINPVFSVNSVNVCNIFVLVMYTLPVSFDVSLIAEYIPSETSLERPVTFWTWVMFLDSWKAIPTINLRTAAAAVSASIKGFFANIENPFFNPAIIPLKALPVFRVVFSIDFRISSDWTNWPTKGIFDIPLKASSIHPNFVFNSSLLSIWSSIDFSTFFERLNCWINADFLILNAFNSSSFIFLDIDFEWSIYPWFTFWEICCCLAWAAKRSDFVLREDVDSFAKASSSVADKANFLETSNISFCAVFFLSSIPNRDSCMEVYVLAELTSSWFISNSSFLSSLAIIRYYSIINMKKIKASAMPLLKSCMLLRG